MATQISVETLSPIAYNQIPVITTELLAQLYGTETVNIKMNFSRNSARFVQGKHFFKLEGNELREFKHRLSLSESVSREVTESYSVKSPAMFAPSSSGQNAAQPVTQKCSKPIRRGKCSKNWKTAISAREKQHQPNSSRRFSHNSQPRKSSSFATCNSGWKKPRTLASSCTP